MTSLPFNPFAGPTIIATAPSTEPQREIWTATLLGAETSLAYNESVSLRMHGDIDVSALSGSLHDLVRRHESLRCTFSADGMTLCILDEVPTELVVEDLTQLEATARESRLAAFFGSVVEETFDLEKGPLFRTALFKLTEDEHLLTFTAHHIVFDGFSTGVLISDWGQLYTARRRGMAPELPPAESFSEYAREVRRATESNAQAEHEQYWINQFRGEIPTLELPYDRPRTPNKTYASRRLDVSLSSDLIRDLKKIGAKNGASLFVTLLSGFGVLLSRLSGQQHIVIGIPAAGQSVGGHDTLVGHCVNMLPFQGNYDSAQLLSDLLRQTRKDVLDAYEHQDYTFGSLLKKLPIPRDPSRLPLVSVVFNMDRGLTPDVIRFDGLSVEVRSNPRHFENFDLFVNAVDLRDRVILECQYNTDLFDLPTIVRWFEEFERLLGSMVTSPTSAIGDLAVVTDKEQESLRRWNNTLADRTSAECVHHLIEAQVDRAPDAVAVEFEQKSITYREFDQRANQLALRLRELGVKRDTLVGLCLERSIEMLIGLTAIHKAGGAYVPLDPGYPQDRLAYMVEDSSMCVLVTDKKLRDELGLRATHVVCIDEEADLISKCTNERPSQGNESATSNSLAYVIYTSGSTGKPKGVLIEHRSVVNLLGSLQSTPGLSNRDVVLAITTLSFDIAVSELIFPLTVGAKIVLVSRDVASDGTRLRQAIEDSGVTFIDATPATYRLLLAAGWQGSPTLTIVCTGEAMPRDLALELVTRVGQLWNGYGPTETTVWSTFYKVAAPVGRILIGRPVDNTQIHILDGRGHQVPIGATGELFIGGSGLARGYLNQPKLTSERFVPDPFAVSTGARMYKTGDLGRYLTDGNVECLGRNDNQVKLRGFRIELGEIENALVAHPNIESAAAIVREDRPGDRRLCAYFVAGSPTTESDLRKHLKTTLPDYMIPQHFVALDRMPLTPSGKTDRKGLPTPSGEYKSNEDFVEPTTASEKLLAELWKQALVVSRVSANDDFFALGGHSLLASQILARLREHGVVIPFRKMFEAPTIAAFARIVDEVGLAGSPIPTQGIPHVADKQTAQLSLSQERLWSLDEMDPNKWRPHVLPAAWRLKGALDIQCLKSAMQFLVDRHDLLRTSFHVVDGKPIQRVSDSADINLQERDISALSPEQRELELTSLFDADAETPYDLTQAPLLRSILVRLAEDEFVLYSSRHNIIWDGWSFDIYLRDLSTAYGAFRRGEVPNLPALPISYVDFAAWHREWLRGPEQTKQLSYWQNQLDGEFAPPNLPTDRTPAVSRTHVGANALVNLSLADAERLTAIGHDQNATLYTVLLSAFATLLARYTGQREFLIGTPVRARTRPETEDIIGPFVNTLALRFKVDPGTTFLDLVAQARDTTLDAFSHQECPLEALGVKAPAVRINFSLQDARTRPTSFGDLAISQQHVMHRSAVNDLTLWAMYSAKSLLVVLNYSTELFSSSTITHFLDAYRTLIVSILANPRERIEHLNIISDNARTYAEQVGHGQLGSHTIATRDWSLARQTAAQETNVAIKQSDLRITYGQLCFAVDNAMHALRAEGVERGSCVVVLASPSVTTCIALMAALELGAKTIPIEGHSPTRLVDAAIASQSPVLVLADAHAREQHANVFERSERPKVASIEPFDVQNGSRIDLTLDTSPERATMFVSIPSIAEDSSTLMVDSTYGEVWAAIDELTTMLKISSSDTVVALDEFGTIAWLIEVMLAISCGATLAMPSSLEAGSNVTADWIESVRPTVVIGPTETLYKLCVNQEWQAPVSRMVSVGLPAQGEILGALLSRADKIFNVISIVEGAVWNCAGQIEEPTDRLRIGHAMGDVHLEVRDNENNLCPIGILGQIQISRANGPSISTMDRARLLGDGSFEYESPGRNVAWYLGRRIQLRAIERELAKHPAIQEAAVVVLNRRPGEPALVGYVVPKSGSSYTETELRKHLRLAFLEPLVPKDFVEVTLIPRHANEDVVSEQLPSPFPRYEHVYLPPRTDSERLLAGIWQTALKMERVGIDDNFFSIGGHSLLCFQVIDDVQRRTGIRLSPRGMLLNTLEQVAVGLENADSPVQVPIRAVTETSLGSKLLGKLRKFTGV